MRKYFLSVSLFVCILASAQQISFKRNFQKGDNAYITTFTELKSMEIILSYTLIELDTSLAGPHTIELHLMKLDKNGNEIWDKLIRKDTTRFAADRFCTQNIDEQSDGSLVFDITLPFGETYIGKYDANGNMKRETYTHNAFGDHAVYGQLIKQRSRNIALPDGSALSVGASFTTVLPKATLSVIDADGVMPIDHYFYTGYFNDAYYINPSHLYTLGVEQSGSIESLVLSDIKTSGATNFNSKTTHKSGERILATALYFSLNRIRVAESLSSKDTGFYVNVYDYSRSGKLLSSVSHKLKCAAVTINLSSNEVDWVLSNKCNSDAGQTIQKLEANNRIGFSFSGYVDTILMLKKLHDESYLFTFSKQPGLNLWKINRLGTLQTGTSAEGLFAPNPAKNSTTLIGNADTYDHALTLKLYDMLGNTLRDYSFEKMEPVTINLSGLREGIYVYSIHTDSGVNMKGKLVVNQRN